MLIFASPTARNRIGKIVRNRGLGRWFLDDQPYMGASYEDLEVSFFNSIFNVFLSK